MLIGEDQRAALASQIREQKKVSKEWLRDNFYDEWELAYKNYKAEADVETGPDGKPDTTLTAIGMPDTWAYVNRTVARITANIPNFRFRSKNNEVANLISRTLMYQWDRTNTQRIQKKHVRQAVICGWSVRPWHWAVEEFVSSKRVDILDPNLDPGSLDLVAKTYSSWFEQKGIPPQMLVDPSMDPELNAAIRAGLYAEFSRGGLLPIKYLYKHYEGPKAEFLYVGDCFPEPDFSSIQESNWFIVERRRNLAFLERLVKLDSSFKDGVNELLEKHPNGDVKYSSNREDEADNLRRRMEAVIQRTRDQAERSSNLYSKEWTITERHTPGANPKLAFAADDVFLGEIEYPYDLAGKIAFTECVLVDDLLCGIGDSVPRVMRGLQKLHGRQVCRRFDLIDNIQRPLMGTTNRELFENPNMIKRHGGFRLVYMRGQGDLWIQPEQAAMAAAATSLSDEAGLMRLYQMFTQETNMSMAANVDPAQNKTATGAKIMQANTDIISKDLNDMFLHTSLVQDGEMMRLLNRSELGDAIEFDATPYTRLYRQEEESWKKEWIAVTPLHFQVDGEIVAEAGSTLADDDETNVAKALVMWEVANSRPDLVNVETARDSLLIAHGKGNEMERWIAKPNPPQSPEVKTSVSFAVKYGELSDPARRQLLGKCGLNEPIPGGDGALEGQEVYDIPVEAEIQMMNAAQPKAPPKPPGGEGEDE